MVGPEIAEAAEVTTANPISTERAAKRVDQVGYSRLDRDEDDADLEPEATSSCSSDLSFGQTSSGQHYNYLLFLFIILS